MRNDLNVEMIAEATRQFVGARQCVFQAYWFAETDEVHLDRLERWAELPQAARVIDMAAAERWRGNFRPGASELPPWLPFPL